MMNMDMSKGSGTPWLDPPVMLHSSRADTCKLTAEQCAYRSGHWRYWYQSDHVYALGTIYFLCATVGVFVISHFVSKYAPSKLKKSPLWRKQEAVVRYVSYKGYQLPALRYWSPSLGVALLLGAGVIFFSAMTLGPRPYYWPNTKTLNYGSSPPIATRTGWMALALLPFVMALSAKANMISALTGVSHEKLQVFHQWASYAMFVLALVHTFPFIVFHVWKGDMVKQWNTQVTYWTGVVALVFQAYLTFMSLPFIRNRFYEFFKATHFLAALIFILFFFFHCDFRLSSWDYFIATGVIYLLCLFTAQFRTYLMHGIHDATIDLLPCGFIRARIPTIISWRPGQHVFVRFLTLDLHSLTAHPFTICSVSHDPEKLGKASEIVLYIKPKRGITARLAKLATKTPGVTKKVLLEGPYGGLSSAAPNLQRFDTVLAIVGGSGSGFSLAIVEEALRLRRQAGTTTGEKLDNIPCRNLQVICATRDPAVAEWYIDEIETLLSTYGALSETSVSVYITTATPSQRSHPHSHPSTQVSDPESATEIVDKDDKHFNFPTHDLTSSPSDQYNIKTQKGLRPNLPTIISEVTGGEVGTGTGTKTTGNQIGIFVCGPASMLHDVRNSAARAQQGVLSGEVGEVYLHSEPFSW